MSIKPINLRVRLGNGKLGPSPKRLRNARGGPAANCPRLELKKGLSKAKIVTTKKLKKLKQVKLKKTKKK